MPDEATTWVIWTWSRRRTEADHLLRCGAARLSGCNAEDVRVARLCPSCGSGGHGQPVLGTGLVRLRASLARSEAVTVVALTLAEAVGVDVEHADAAAFDGFAGVALHTREEAATVRHRTVTWVRKEAVLKAAGTGLEVDPSTLRVSDPQDRAALLEWPGRDRLRDRTRLYDVAGIPGHVAGLAVVADTTHRIVVTRAEPAAAARGATS